MGTQRTFPNNGFCIIKHEDGKSYTFLLKQKFWSTLQIILKMHMLPCQCAFTMAQQTQFPGMKQCQLSRCPQINSNFYDTVAFIITLLINNLPISEIQTHLFFFFQGKRLVIRTHMHTYTQQAYIFVHIYKIHTCVYVCVYIHTCTYEYLKFIEYLFKYQNNFSFIMLLGFSQYIRLLQLLLNIH